MPWNPIKQKQAQILINLYNWSAKQKKYNISSDE